MSQFQYSDGIFPVGQEPWRAEYEANQARLQAAQRASDKAANDPNQIWDLNAAAKKITAPPGLGGRPVSELNQVLSGTGYRVAQYTGPESYVDDFAYHLFGANDPFPVWTFNTQTNVDPFLADPRGFVSQFGAQLEQRTAGVTAAENAAAIAYAAGQAERDAAARRDREMAEAAAAWSWSPPVQPMIQEEQPMIAQPSSGGFTTPYIINDPNNLSISGILSGIGSVVGGLATGGIPGAVGAIGGLIAGGGGSNCPTGYTKVGGNCVQLSAGLPGGIPMVVPPGGTTVATGGQAGGTPMGSWGGVAPQVRTQYSRRCPRGGVLAMDGNCYPKAMVPKQFRMWKPAPKPLLSAQDGKILNRARTLENKLNRVAGRFLAPSKPTRKKKGRGRARK